MLHRYPLTTLFTTFTILLAIADADILLFLTTLIFGVPAGAYAGQVVWITGASSGIGEALAYKFAKGNATLVLSARREGRLRSVLARCMDLGAAPASSVELLDVATELPQLSAVVERVLGRVRRLDVLVLNAGATQRGLAADTPLPAVRQLMELNFFAAVEHARLALPHLTASPTGGQIVVTSSFTGKIGTPVSTAYSATKHALHGFFGGMRAEVPASMRITMVCPGPVQSEIALAAGVKEGNENKMPTGRAAELMLSATYHGFMEAWISPHPPLLFLYLGQYLPSVTAYISARGPGRARVEAFRKGVDLFSNEAWSEMAKAAAK